MFSLCVPSCVCAMYLLGLVTNDCFALVAVVVDIALGVLFSGKKFLTSWETINHQANSMLASMFKGNFNYATDEDGFAFIDRDGKIDGSFFFTSMTTFALAFLLLLLLMYVLWTVYLFVCWQNPGVHYHCVRVHLRYFLICSLLSAPLEDEITDI